MLLIVLLFVSMSECATISCPHDLTGKLEINVESLATLLVGWGGSGAADFDFSGRVDIADLAELLVNWGPCPGKCRTDAHCTDHSETLGVSCPAANSPRPFCDLLEPDAPSNTVVRSCHVRCVSTVSCQDAATDCQGAVAPFDCPSGVEHLWRCSSPLPHAQQQGVCQALCAQCNVAADCQQLQLPRASLCGGVSVASWRCTGHRCEPQCFDAACVSSAECLPLETQLTCLDEPIPNFPSSNTSNVSLSAPILCIGGSCRARCAECMLGEDCSRNPFLERTCSQVFGLESAWDCIEFRCEERCVNECDTAADCALLAAAQQHFQCPWDLNQTIACDAGRCIIACPQCATDEQCSTYTSECQWPISKSCVDGQCEHECSCTSDSDCSNVGHECASGSTKVNTCVHNRCESLCSECDSNADCPGPGLPCPLHGGPLTSVCTTSQQCLPTCEPCAIDADCDGFASSIPNSCPVGEQTRLVCSPDHSCTPQCSECSTAADCAQRYGPGGAGCPRTGLPSLGWQCSSVSARCESLCAPEVSCRTSGDCGAWEAALLPEDCSGGYHAIAACVEYPGSDSRICSLRCVECRGDSDCQDAAAPGQPYCLDNAAPLYFRCHSSGYCERRCPVTQRCTVDVDCLEDPLQVITVCPPGQPLVRYCGNAGLPSPVCRASCAQCSVDSDCYQGGVVAAGLCPYGQQSAGWVCDQESRQCLHSCPRCFSTYSCVQLAAQYCPLGAIAAECLAGQCRIECLTWTTVQLHLHRGCLGPPVLYSSVLGSRCPYSDAALGPQCTFEPLARTLYAAASCQLHPQPPPPLGLQLELYSPEDAACQRSVQGRLAGTLQCFELGNPQARSAKFQVSESGIHMLLYPEGACQGEEFRSSILDISTPPPNVCGLVTVVIEGAQSIGAFNGIVRI